MSTAFLSIPAARRRRAVQKLRDIMTHDVVTVSPTMTLAEASAHLARHHVSGAPVVKAGKVIGVLSTQDLAAGSLGRLRVADRMTQRVIAMRPEARAADATAIMLHEGIHRVLVMDGPHLLGIVSASDIVAPRRVR
jgi:CBS domain-containing protein